MRHGRGGPWTVITDLPRAGHEPAGPPPGYLALAGVATCTLVTVAGVISRRGPQCERMRIEMAADGTAVRERLVVDMPLGDVDTARLTRAAGYCPVGKIFAQRLLTVDDRVTLNGDGTADPPRLPSRVALPVLPAGALLARWHGETREWVVRDGAPVLDQEGEVTVHVDCGAGRRWALVGGHTSAGWAPRPSPYAKAALAASTLMTVRSLAGPLGIDPASLRVEVRAISGPPEGGKRESQELAAEGRAAPVRWERVLHADVNGAASAAAVADAMRLDPIYLHTQRADLFSAHEVIGADPDVTDPIGAAAR